MCLTKPDEAAYFAAGAGKYQSYYIDSGATNHYIDEANLLQKFFPFEKNKHITTAKHGNLMVVRLGTLWFTTLVDGNKSQGTLEDIYYIPGIKTHLISLGNCSPKDGNPILTSMGYPSSIHKESSSFALQCSAIPTSCCCMQSVMSLVFIVKLFSLSGN